jgi:hypothetical protein
MNSGCYTQPTQFGLYSIVTNISFEFDLRNEIDRIQVLRFVSIIKLSLIHFSYLPGLYYGFC